MIATDSPNVLPKEEELQQQNELDEESKTSMIIRSILQKYRNLFVEKKKKKKTENMTQNVDKEYGVSRGIDFYRVANIINFDFPTDFDSYVHRVGRTARVDQKGLYLSRRQRLEIIN